MKSLIRSSLLLLFAGTILFGMVFFAAGENLNSSGSEDRLAGLDEFITKTLDEYEVPGAVVGIVENDSVVYLKGFGVRELGKPGKVDPDTRFQIASVSKYFTAGDIGSLVDEKKLDWDTPIVKYLPGFALKDAYAGNHTTLRDLLAHRSGLKKYDGELLSKIGYNNSEILHRVRFLEPGCSFREQYQYSNVGYYIAGEVAAEVDNRSWENLTEYRILQPLGMKRSGTGLDTLFLDDNHAAAHSGINEPVHIIESERSSLPAAGAVVSTGRDMTQWLRMLLGDGTVDGREILKPETVKTIHSANTPLGSGGVLQDPNAAAGLGCDTNNFLGERVIEKNGALNGVRSLVTIIPSKKSGIVIIANKQLTAFPEAIQAEFLERYIEKSGIDLQERMKIVQDMIYSITKSPDRPKNPEPATMSPAKVAGKYTSDLYGDMLVSKGTDTGNMTVQLGPGKYPGFLSHWTNNTWHLSWSNPDEQSGFINFTASPSGFITGITSDDFGPFSRV
ncbi:MAG: serine hydrolase [Methanospirillum sp.]|nr:serine hydrolase [Methanospirillum sp.]